MPKVSRLQKSPKSPVYASRPPSPVTERNVERQRRSDEKVASLLGVQRILVDYTQTPVVRRSQESPEEVLLQKDSLSPDLPRKDVQQELYDISERPSEESQARREELILKDVRFDGALETDPQQRPTIDLSKLFDLQSMQIKSDVDEEPSTPMRSSSQLSDPFDLSIGSLSPRDSLQSNSAYRDSTQTSDRFGIADSDGQSIDSRKSIEESLFSSRSSQKTGPSSRTTWNNPNVESRTIGQEVDELFADFVDIDALRQIEWKKEDNKFMPSPQERDILIVIRKTMARLLALNMLTRDLQDARGLPLNNFEVPKHFYRMSDPSILQNVSDAASTFASGYRLKHLCREYDQWAYENHTENLATLAANDCYRQYTEGWQKVFHEYGPWAWNLPDGGQLSELKPR